MSFNPAGAGGSPLDAQNRGPGGNPLGSGGAPRGPAAQASGNIPMGSDIPRLVLIEKITFTTVNHPGGAKQIVGKMEMKNTSDKNVVDYRVELVWGANIYSVNPVQGRGNKLRPLEQRVLRASKEGEVQMMSQIINNPPDGSPYSFRLQAWLDGRPGTSVDEYLIR